MLFQLTRGFLRHSAFGISKYRMSIIAARALSTPGVNIQDLKPHIKSFIDEQAKLCTPDKIYVCDGSEEETKAILQKLVDDGRLEKLPKYDNCFYAHTAKEDVARVEKQTFVCSVKKNDAVPDTKPGVTSTLGNWKDPVEMTQELDEKFKGCMKGRTMYVIPYSMGPIGSPLSKIGIELTDSEYVVASMNVMTRIGKKVLDTLGNEEFVKCTHSVGHPLQPGDNDVHWPCNPKKLAVVQFPERNEIRSFGSGYGGNSLLGKKCFALRIANTIAKREGWLAEHMLILALTDPNGRKRYIAGAFPSACGKTNLAMLTPTLPGWKAECVGDDIAWMRFDEQDGTLRAINPEYGFFGVAPGTNNQSNPNAMKTLFSNTVFTNTAKTSDGGVWWEGMGEVDNDVSITTWLGKENWEQLSKEDRRNSPAAHPNSRFCTPTKQYPLLDADWESPRGVPIDAIFFGGRRPDTIPLIYESTSWTHGVFIGAQMKSEGTAAAADMGKTVQHDPFAMRPFFGYNFVQYLEHWLSLQDRPGVKLPKIFHVNWFRKDQNGKFIWPGFGDNLRVIDWALRRCDGEAIANESPLGLIPKPGSLDTSGLSDVDMEALFAQSKAELEADVADTQTYFDRELPGQLPQPLQAELNALRERISKM